MNFYFYPLTILICVGLKQLKEPKISEVESIWPESSLSREIILECVDFRLNLNVSFNSLQENSNSSNKSQINVTIRFYCGLLKYSN